MAQGKGAEGLSSIKNGLDQAQAIGDQERILIGHLHLGRAVAALGRIEEARATLEEGLRQAEASQMHRLKDYLRTELENLP